MILPILLCLSATYLIEQTLAAVQVTGYNRLPSSISVHAGGASPRGFPVLWDTAVIIPNGNDLSNEYLITTTLATPDNDGNHGSEQHTLSVEFISSPEEWYDIGNEIVPAGNPKDMPRRSRDPYKGAWRVMFEPQNPLYRYADNGDNEIERGDFSVSGDIVDGGSLEMAFRIYNPQSTRLYKARAVLPCEAMGANFIQCYSTRIDSREMTFLTP